ncbi:OmpA family protein [Curvivirga aplysinae]|uniref:OmpA family protein n=1 Tax=Curvivirga aplysinae TaxID=2529852 RepID=UPI0012BCCB97|nr:OmpA family protein [Curvivirga aplysinae]MTI11415.1 OmpA family protein [Curvivirga aplysinae]
MKPNSKFITHPVIALAGLLTLNACLYTDIANVENLRATQVNQNNNLAFEKALAQEYKRLALYEADEMYDTTDAGTFAAKGLAANKGERPLPEKPENWDLNFGVERLENARMRLTALMARDAAYRAPHLSAQAQASFDCWVEQMEEGWQWDHIEYCQTNFQQAAIKLEKKLADPHRVSFEVNEARLNHLKTSQIMQIAEEAKRLDAPLASIVGYTDTTGSKAYNMELSLARADEVASLLVMAGYPADRIAISAYGEDRPLIKTADETSQAVNRRVEITFYPNQQL